MKKLLPFLMFLAGLSSCEVLPVSATTNDFRKSVVLVNPATNPASPPTLAQMNQAFSNVTVNVSSYGAFGNGVSNDTLAVQRAIDFVQNNGGGTVYFPAGTFLHTKTWVITNNYTTLAGANGGAVTFLATNDFGDQVVFGTGTPYIQFPNLHDIQIAQSSANVSFGAGLVFSNCLYASVDNYRGYHNFVNLKIVSCLASKFSKIHTSSGENWTALVTNSAGIWFAEGGGVNNSEISLSQFEAEGNSAHPDYLHYAIRVDNCDGLSLHQGHAAWAQFGFITIPATAISPLDSIESTDVGYDTCTNTGVAFANNGATIHTGAAGGITFKGGFFYLCGRHFSYTLTGQGSSFQLDTIPMTSCNGDSVYVSTGAGSTIKGLTLKAVSLQGTNLGSGVHVTGNVTNMVVSGITLQQVLTQELPLSVVNVDSNTDVITVSNINSCGLTNASGGSTRTTTNMSIGTHNKFDSATINP